MSAQAGCRGAHKPSFRHAGRDMGWYDYDGSWWHIFECRVCGREQRIADWYFWGKEPADD